MPLLPSKLRTYKYPGRKCPVCSGNLYFSKATNSFASATCLDSETLTLVRSQASRCNSCGSALRHNFVWLGGQKINCMTFHQMQRAGVYFVTQKTCFTMKYLHLCYLRLLRAKTSPGQEAAVRLLADSHHPLQFWQEHSLRDNLLHALEGFAVAKNEPDKVIEFNLEYPAKSIVNMSGASSHVHVFEPPTSVTAVCCDGNFGVHRALLSGVDPPRSVRLKGKPRKLIGDFTRTCSCKQKDAVRQVLPDRTAGWQFVLDPSSQRLLGACEHLVNERSSDKVRLLQAVLDMPNMKVDLIIHDDACHLEESVVAFFVLAMPYSVVSVSGHMSRKGGGKFTLDLGVSAADSTPDREPPAAKTLHQQLQDGSLPAHPSKAAMTVRNLQTQIANIKRSVGLGSNSWSDEAEEALKTWLRRPKLSSASSSISGDRDSGSSLKRKMLVMAQTIDDLEGVVARAQWDAEKHEETVTELKKLKAILKENGLQHLYEEAS
ncbi:unnamed protein product [Symbiodinium sp. CCMP2592]|nr:unnamed protein product [Symbiodinium sp. CCMP2592]CAE7446275.1 unnamed protein product [Symbiodinium sp. CCMP2592]